MFFWGPLSDQGPQRKSNVLELKLDTNGFFVSKGTADTMFGADEILYPLMEDGGLVYVSSRVDAGQ